MEPLSAMLLAAIGAVAGELAAGAPEGARGELWRLAAWGSDGPEAGELAAAVDAARRELVADDAGAVAALALFAERSSEGQAFLAVAVAELLFSPWPNHSRLADAYQRHVGFVGLPHGAPPPPWPAVAPHVEALAQSLGRAALGFEALRPLAAARANLVGQDIAAAGGSVESQLAELLRQPRLSPFGVSVSTTGALTTGPAPAVNITVSATDGATISNSPIWVVLGERAALPELDMARLARLEADYRAFLVARYADLDARPLTHSGAHARLPLTQLYLPLAAEVVRGGRAAPADLHKLVRESSALVLLGAAGSGKSTLVRRLLLAFGERDAPRRFGLADIWLPILFPGAAFAAALARNPTLAPLDFLAVWFAQRQQPDFTLLLRRALLAGRALVIVDGLDEPATMAGRLALRRVLEDFVQAWALPANRFLVTSRPESYAELPLDEARFLRATLLPLDDTRIEGLARSWFAAHGEADPAAAARSFRAALPALPAARELAANPLLLGLLLANARTNQPLPARRVDLYARSVALLADTWRQSRSLAEEPLDAGLTALFGGERLAEPLAELLGVAALRTLAALSAEPPTPTDLREQLELLIAERAPQANPTETIDRIARATGLFQLDADGSLSLPHRSFFDYLTGVALAAPRSAAAVPNYAAAFAGLASWAEPLRFAIAGARQPAAQRLVRTLLAAPANGADRGRPVVTAGAGLAERGDAPFDQSTREAVLTALVRLLADTQATAAIRVAGGEALGLLGDPRLLDVARGEARGFEALSDVPGYWCPLAPGTFSAGDERYEHRRPAMVRGGFLIGRYLVTNAEFAAFIDANGPAGYDPGRPWWPNGWRRASRRSRPRFWGERPYANPAQPVVGVNWYEAAAYCRWLTLEGRRRGWLATDEEIRLPTWRERELAARSGAAGQYPWGDDEPSPERANYVPGALGRPTPVGCFPAGTNALGILDLAGNVGEWTASVRDQLDNTLAQRDIAPQAEVVLADSSFSDGAEALHCGAHAFALPTIPSDNRGFRVVCAPAEKE